MDEDDGERETEIHGCFLGIGFGWKRVFLSCFVIIVGGSDEEDTEDTLCFH